MAEDSFWATGPAREREPRRWSFDPERLLAGDWLGSIGACLAGLLVMAVWVVIDLAISGSLTKDAAGVTTAKIFALVGTAVGGSASYPADALGQPSMASVSVSVMPLLFTISGFGVLSWMTVRRLRRQPRTSGEFWLQAVRTIVVMTVLLIILGFVARHGHPGDAGYVRIKVAYTAFFGAGMTLVALAVTFFVVSAGILPGRVGVWRQRFVGPALGMTVLLSLAALLGLVYVLVQILATPHDLSRMTNVGLISRGSRRAEIGDWLALGVNQSWWMLLWAMGNTLHMALRGFSNNATLATFTDHNGLYWLLPVIAAVLWLIAAGVATLYAATPREGRRNAYRLAVLTPLVTSALFVLVGYSIHPPNAGATLREHFRYWWAFLLGILWAGGAGVLAPELVMRLPGSLIVRVRRTLMRRFFAPPTVEAATEPASASAE